MVNLKGRTQVAWLFCLPAILVLLGLAGYPLVRTFYFSFTDARLGNLDHFQWIGLENYTYLLQDTDWWIAVWNTLVFTFCSVSFELIFGIGVALILNSQIKGRGWVRTAVLVPWAIPAVVSARIWAWMFNDLYGVLNEILLKVGLIKHPIAWLADDQWVRWTLVVVDVWKTTPFMALMILTGLQSIPKSVHEAALVEGVSSWKEFFHITLPLLKPAIWVALLFRTLDALKIFDLPFVLSSNSKSTAMISIYARQQMVDFQEIGYGSAASFLIFCIVAGAALIYLISAKEHLGLEKS